MLKLNKFIITIFLAFAVSFGVLQEADAASIPGGDVYISGDEMVWHAPDDSGNRQIFYKNVATEETKQITNTATAKTFPKVKDGLIVWQEKRDVDNPQFEWNVYGYQLSTGIEKKLNPISGNHIEPTTDGRYVTWHNNKASAEIYVYDWSTGSLKQFANGRFPKVAGGSIVYKQQTGTGLDLYTIATGEIRTVVPSSNTEYVSWFAFNGSHVLFIISNYSETQYALVNVHEVSSNVKKLTLMTKKERDFGELVVGDSYVAWMEDKNGVAQIMVANVEAGDVKQATFGTVDQRPLAFTGNVLISTKDFATLDSENVKKYFPVPPSGGSSQLPLPQKDVVIKDKIGPNGGILKSDDGRVSLEFAPGTWDQETEIELKEVVKLQAEQNPVSPFQKMASVWDIHFTQSPSKSVILKMAYEDADMFTENIKKLGIYSYRPERGWNYEGGRVNGQLHTVQSEVITSGVYSILFNDVKFADVEGHWAGLQIEVLASRGILNGMQEGVFEPSSKLTRAQFTKMLAAAMGLKPVSAHGRFTDVTSDHWGAGWIEAAAAKGIVEGGDQGFQPNVELTREQMMAMIIRAMGKENEAIQERGELPFADANEISSWAQGYAGLAVKLGLVEGSAEGIRPQSTSTRGEAAMVIFRLLVKQDKL